MFIVAEARGSRNWRKQLGRRYNLSYACVRRISEKWPLVWTDVSREHRVDLIREYFIAVHMHVLSYREMCEVTGLNKNQVAGLIHRIRHGECATPGLPRPLRKLRSAAQHNRSKKRLYDMVSIPIDTMHRLAFDAARRGVSARALVRTILDEVVEDKLVDAILDDGHELEDTHRDN